MRRLIAVLAALTLACGDEPPTDPGDSLDPVAAQASVVEPVTSTDSVATLRDTVRIKVKVLDDATGDVLSDVRVRFSLNRDRCGSFEFGTDRSDSDGLASDFWHVGQDALTCEVSASTVNPEGELIDTALLTFEVQPGEPFRHIFDNRAFREYDPLVLPEDAWRDKLANPVHLDYRTVVTMGPAHVVSGNAGTKDARTIFADTTATTESGIDTLGTGRAAIIQGGDTVATGDLLIEAHTDGTTVCIDFPPLDGGEDSNECFESAPGAPK